MAKRKSTGTGWVILLIVVLGLMTGIPREVWIALSAAILCMYFVWQNLKGAKRHVALPINTDMQKTAAIPDLGDYPITPSQLEPEHTPEGSRVNQPPSVDKAKKTKPPEVLWPAHPITSLRAGGCGWNKLTRRHGLHW